MGREQTFLQRLAEQSRTVGQQRYGLATAYNVDRQCDSVRDHLKRLLNARHGMSEAVPDYGLPALADVTTILAEHAPLLQRAIRYAIEKYEPRLRQVRVVVLPEDEWPGRRSPVFAIEAILLGPGGEQTSVRYSAILSHNGQFDILD